MKENVCISPSSFFEATEAFRHVGTLLSDFYYCNTIARLRELIFALLLMEQL
jgi:hypothetical protein